MEKYTVKEHVQIIQAYHDLRFGIVLKIARNLNRPVMNGTPCICCSIRYVYYIFRVKFFQKEVLERSPSNFVGFQLKLMSEKKCKKKNLYKYRFVILTYVTRFLSGSFVNNLFLCSIYICKIIVNYN